jgi:translation initiation factor 6
MHVITSKYQGSSNIGLFCYATDKYCLVPVAMQDNQMEKFAEVLKVPIHRMRAAGTDLLGVFFAGNDECLLVPEIMFDSELDELKSLNIPFKVIKSELTALGNNLLIHRNMCIASTEFKESAIKEIEKALKATVKKGKISGFDIVGSLAKLNKNGCLVSSEILEFEKKFLKDNLKLKLTLGTLNFGSQYISSSLVCNSNGFVIGEESGGPEIQNADEALGFI